MEQDLYRFGNNHGLGIQLQFVLAGGFDAISAMSQAYVHTIHTQACCLSVNT